MKRTNVGRVVYDRPTHFFRPKDAVRILSRMNWDVEPDDKLFEDMISCAIYIFEAFQRRMGRFLAQPASTVVNNVQRMLGLLTTVADSLWGWLKDIVGL